MGKRVMGKDMTFTARSKNGLKEIPYEHEFEMYGETFVIHHVLRLPETWTGEPLYRASHRDTGFGIPDCAQSTPAASEHQAKAVMAQYGQERVLEVIKRAKEAGEPVDDPLFEGAS